MRGKVFLGDYPLTISAMESLFIGLLCYFHTGLESPFRYYFILSLICCAIRHSARVTLLTCCLQWLSCLALYLTLPPDRRDLLTLLLILVVLGWVTWAASAMSLLLKRFSEHLGQLNSALRENQTLLEARIDERTRELQESQAHVLHQEKMAAFGLLAAGIAHEVGNPLTSISTIVQMLEKHGLDDYTRERLALVGGQLQRIQGTLRELIEFSRPASSERARCHLAAIVDEALHIAKYYKGMKSRAIATDISKDLPELFAVRDQLVQVFLNLILNAIDATEKYGRIDIRAMRDGEWLVAFVRDDGTGLGLFVTRQLIEEIGGEVSFTSAVGEGAEFQVKLPIHKN
jgi:signal transduction histidine kinase